MKKAMLMLLVCVCVTSGIAQIRKGRFMTTGNLSMSSSAYTTAEPFGTGDYATQTASAKLSGGYFVTNNIAIGLAFEYSYYNSKTTYNGQGDPTTYETINSGISPSLF